MRHSFTNSLLRSVFLCASCIAAHSWIDNISQTTNLSNIGYIRGYEGHLDAISSFIIQSTTASQQVCKSNEQSQNYTAQYPMLKMQAGDTFVANYTENGHVTKDVLAPDEKPHPGNYTWYLAANSAASPDPMATYGSLTSVGQVVATGNFDDGVCAEDATKGRDGPRNCQSFVTLPSSLSAGTYELIWLWNFPKVAGVVEMYSSCMDVQVLPADQDQAQAASAATATPSIGVVNVVAKQSDVAVVTKTMYITKASASRTLRTSTITNTNSVYTTITPSTTTTTTTTSLTSPTPTTTSDSDDVVVIMTTIETTIGATGTQAPGIYTLVVPVTTMSPNNPLVDANNVVVMTTMKTVTVTMPSTALETS